MSNSPLADIIETFQSVDSQMRLELLLDYSKKLPPIPAELAAQRDAGLNRVDECMTPVFLWVQRIGDDDAVLRIHADVAEEAPTVKGFVSLIVQAIDDQPIEAAAALPNDLLEQLRLQDVIRMNRVVGLNAILSRIKREAAAAA